VGSRGVHPVGTPVPPLAPTAFNRFARFPVFGGLDDLDRVVADLAGRDIRISRLILTAKALDAEAKKARPRW
jgi:hypothetical protein